MNFFLFSTWLFIVIGILVAFLMLIVLPIKVHKRRKKKLAQKIARWRKKHPHEDYDPYEHRAPGLFRFIGFLIKAALFIGILGGAIGYLPYRHNVEMNLACKEKFLSEPPYGQKVQVFDENINVVIEGEGDEVLILYPTAKLPTPYLYYKPLISALSSTFKVVTVEPFGYGLSDSTTRERSLENVVIELHEVVSSLGFDHYSILTDGFGGIPIMEYIDMYETEVKAYFNIDTLIGALNKQYNFVGDFDNFGWLNRAFQFTGYQRLISQIKVDAILPQTDYEYSNEDKELYRQMILTYSDTANQLEEITKGPEWCTASKRAYTSANVPNCSFVSSDFITYVADLIGLADKTEITYTLHGETKTIPADAFWTAVHDNPLNEKNKTSIIQGKHIAISCYEDIASKMLAWFETI